jgi:predicted GIY-YIG superfamily endonuclease
MGKQRDWYTYEFKRGNKVIHGGITQNPERREDEHKRTLSPSGHLKIVGNAKTEEGARKWEKDKGYS